jgi:hypothetical protein
MGPDAALAPEFTHSYGPDPLKMGPTEHWFLIHTFIRRCETSILHFRKTTMSSATSVNEKCRGKWELVADLPWLEVQIPQLTG